MSEKIIDTHELSVLVCQKAGWVVAETKHADGSFIWQWKEEKKP